MAGTGVGKFSSTAGSNTASMTVNFAENMAPSNVNNAARELMGHMRDMYEQLGDGYFEFGDGDGTYTVARGDADTITITSSADISGIYFPGRKIRITDGGANVVEGTIASSSHSSTTQTVNLTGISLASGTPTKVELGIDTAAFGGRVILDDDGDTYIEAPTDDTIDIYVGGAKDFVITANTFTAESGSTIAAQTISAAGNVDFNADLDVDGTTNLDVVDIDGAVDMASTLQVDGAITGSSTIVATSFNGIPFFQGDTGSIYTHDVSGTDSTAQYNTAYGLNALDAITTGDDNVAIGYQAGTALQAGAYNVAVGRDALSTAQGDRYNVAVGFEALKAFNTGTSVNDTENVAVGVQAGLRVNTGSACTIIGGSAGNNITSGSNNTCVGQGAGGSASPSNITTSSNSIVLGNNSVTDASIKVDWTVTSDKRDKTDVEALTMGLDFVNKLNPVTYRWDMRSDYDDDATPDGTHKKQRLFSGLLAQDVEVLEREYGYKVEDETALITSKGEDGNYGLTYQRLIPVLINAVKELSAEVKTLKGE